MQENILIFASWTALFHTMIPLYYPLILRMVVRVLWNFSVSFCQPMRPFCSVA